MNYGFVPEERRLADFRLLVMDMDSTLITIETTDELVDMVRLKPQSLAHHAKPIVREKATHVINYVGLDGVLNLFS